MLAPGGSTRRAFGGLEAFNKANTDKSTITEAKVLGYSEADEKEGLIPEDFLSGQQYLSRAEVSKALATGVLDPFTESILDVNGDGIITMSEVDLVKDDPFIDLIPATTTGSKYNADDPFGSVLTSDETLAERYGDRNMHSTQEMPFMDEWSADYSNGEYKSGYVQEYPGLKISMDSSDSQNTKFLIDVQDPEKIRMGFAKGYCVQRDFVIDTNNDGVPDISLPSSWMDQPWNVIIKIGDKQTSLLDYALENKDRGIGGIAGWDYDWLAGERAAGNI